MQEVPEHWQAHLDRLEAGRHQSLEHGGPERVARHHAQGKLTARERIAYLTEAFSEIGQLACVNVTDAAGNAAGQLPASYVCGLGQVDGRFVAVGAEDFTVRGGAITIYLDRLKGGHGGFVEDLAHEYRIPLLLLNEGVGGDVSTESADHARIPSSFSLSRPLELLHEVPVLSAALGPTAGGSAGRTMLAHFSVMTKQAYLFAGGPPLVERALGQKVTKEELGGWEVHGQNGVVDNVAEDDEDAIDQLRQVLSYLPQNVWELPPRGDRIDPIDRRCEQAMRTLPASPRGVYDMHNIIEDVVDDGSWFEIGAGWGRSLHTGLAHVDGIPVGVLGTNPRHLAGAMDGAAADKQVRFVDFCSTFHLPLIYFVDVPGFMIGIESERSGILRRGMRAVRALFEADVPLITVHIRRAYGMAANATSNPDRLGLRLAWPTAALGDMPIEGGVAAAFRREIESADNPEEFQRQAEQRMLAKTDPFRTAAAFGFEELIDPRETRERVAVFLNASLHRLHSSLLTNR